jgi:hypothetical protein
MGHRSFFQIGIGLGALLTVNVLGFACSSSSDNTGGGGTGTSAGTGGTGTGTGGSGTGTGGTGTGTGGSGTGTGGAVIPPGDGGGTYPVDPCLLGETKGGACSATVGEGKSCYNTCGPDSVGYKLETCTGGLYAEGMCAYLSSRDYSCYKIPATLPACPMDPTGKTASQACTVPTCMPCGPNYGDSGGVGKVGYCVCNAGGKWTCGSTNSNSWPCSAPGGPNTNPGCQ